MNRYKKSRLVVVASLILLLSCSLLFLTVGKSGLFGGADKQAADELSVVDRFFSEPTHFFSQQQEGLGALLNAYKENQELKRTLVLLENQLLEKETLEQENRSLRENMKLMEAYGEKSLIPAMVTVRLPLSWTNQLILGGGTKQGIQKGMLVLANGGLIGVVDESQEESARVILLTNADDFTKIPVKISSGNQTIYGILSGYDTDTDAFIVRQLNSMEAIAEGSPVVTSDLAGATPSNLQIGTVLSVHQKSGSLDRELFIKPSASFSNLHSVLVVGG